MFEFEFSFKTCNVRPRVSADTVSGASFRLSLVDSTQTEKGLDVR